MRRIFRHKVNVVEGHLSAGFGATKGDGEQFRVVQCSSG